MPPKYLSNRDNVELPQNSAASAEDPVIAMLGVGQQLWETESGDAFVERLRSEDVPAPPTMRPQPPAEFLLDVVWRRVVSHQGELFHTVTGLPFTFEVEGTGIWFFRNETRIERKLTRSQFALALERCPLTSTTQIKDLMDYPYLFAVLNDGRVRGQDW